MTTFSLNLVNVKKMRAPPSSLQSQVTPSFHSYLPAAPHLPIHPAPPSFHTPSYYLPPPSHLPFPARGPAPPLYQQCLQKLTPAQDVLHLPRAQRRLRLQEKLAWPRRPGKIWSIVCEFGMSGGSAGKAQQT